MIAFLNPAHPGGGTPILIYPVILFQLCSEAGDVQAEGLQGWRFLFFSLLVADDDMEVVGEDPSWEGAFFPESF